MKFFLFILLLILMPLSVFAAEKVEQTAPALEQKQPVLKKTEQKKQPPIQPSFQPTEKIQADTVVAFPADI